MFYIVGLCLVCAVSEDKANWKDKILASLESDNKLTNISKFFYLQHISYAQYVYIENSTIHYTIYIYICVLHTWT